MVEVTERDGTVLTGRVLASSSLAYLDYQVLTPARERRRTPHGRYVGVSALGNPRVRVLKRGQGRPVPTPEWSDA